MIFSLASRAECIVAVKLIFSVIFSYIEQSIGRRFSWVEDIPAISKSSHCVYDYKENHGSPSMMYCFFYNIASKRKKLKHQGPFFPLIGFLGNIMGLCPFVRLYPHKGTSTSTRLLKPP